MAANAHVFHCGTDAGVKIVSEDSYAISTDRDQAMKRMKTILATLSLLAVALSATDKPRRLWLICVDGK
jgi:hypothetical protein